MKTRNEGIILISLFLLTTVLFTGTGSLCTLALTDFRASMRMNYLHQAFYLAEAAIDQKLVELTTGNKNDLAGGLSAPGCAGTYFVDYQLDPMTGDEILVATGTVNAGGQNFSRTLRVTVQQAPPFAANAAVAISGIASTNGNVTVDGRDHDADGNLTGAPGVFGIATSSPTFIQGGSSQVGGNGIAPAQPADPTTYQINSPPLPPTPEAVLGVSDGALDAYKTSTPPSSPFSGIVYLTANWEGVNLDGSSGILICHTPAGDAYLKNVHGMFKGLIITDDIIHINGDAEIRGAVLGLKTGGVTLGNGAGEVKFSSQLLANLPLVKYTVTSWQDASNDTA